MNLVELVDGINFSVQPGKHEKSKLVIHGEYAFKVGKVLNRDGRKIYYLKCKFSNCPARAQIRNNFLYMSNVDFKPHECSREGASSVAWSALEAIARMKVRAMKESATLLVG